MRDAHRMKEKLDLSLDNRQIVSLLVGAIVVMGAVFVLGVVVGKKLSESGRTESATDILAALDQKKEAMEKAEEAKTEVTFDRVLTTPTAAGQPEVRVVTLAPPKPVEKPVEAPVAAPVETAAADDASADAEQEAVVAPSPAPAETPARTELAKATEAAAKPRTETVTASSILPARTPKSSALNEAIARAQRPTAPVPAKGSYTLQLSASQVRAEADKFAQNVKAKGYGGVTVVSAEVPGKGTWYRVRLGRFPSKDAAQKYLLDFRRETQLEAFIASVE